MWGWGGGVVWVFRSHRIASHRALIHSAPVEKGKYERDGEVSVDGNEGVLG